MDAFFKANILSIETLVDLCAIFGVSNRGILGHMLDRVAEKRPTFRDEMIGFMAMTVKKIEEVTKHMMDSKKGNAREKQAVEEYAQFLNDAVWNMSVLHQIAPWVGDGRGSRMKQNDDDSQIVYCLVTDAHSLLYPSELKVVLNAAYQSLSSHPAIQERMLIGCY